MEGPQQSILAQVQPGRETPVPGCSPCPDAAALGPAVRLGSGTMTPVDRAVE